MKQPWLDEEIGVRSSLRQAGLLLRAGLRRRSLVLSFTVLLALVFGAAVAFAKHDYAPRFVLRVSETEREPTGSARLTGQLSEYVRQAIFTSEPLYELIRRHGLYPKLMQRNARAALDSFREDITVEAYQNYFVEDRLPKDLPRSARLAVSYHAKDPELALAVTRDLGELIVQRELSVWRKQALDAANAADFERDSAERALLDRNEQIFSTQSKLQQTTKPDPTLQVEFVGLVGSLGSLERRLLAAERRSDALDLSAAMAKHDHGLHFEVVDDASVPSGKDQFELRLLLAGTSFIVGVPLLAMAIGAFDPKRGQT
ncbi:MAG TPA: hypothetical protein VK745_14215 [Polyangiaceae bacterium]|jgi:hypothetical protein|nr:hypothetical protein [Polyangiaceae bacterium]